MVRSLIYLIAGLMAGFRLCMAIPYFEIELGHHANLIFQAFAHILVGGLFGAWFWARSQKMEYAGERVLTFLGSHFAWMGWLAVMLTVVEVVAAGATIIQKRMAVDAPVAFHNFVIPEEMSIIVPEQGPAISSVTIILNGKEERNVSDQERIIPAHYRR